MGDDFDIEAASSTATTASGLPVAATVKGDPAAIETVLDKLRAKTGRPAFLGSDSSGDLVVIGPTPEYRQHVLAGGHLGDDDTFRSVVPDAGAASSVFYVDIDVARAGHPEGRGRGDQETVDNSRPCGRSGSPRGPTAA